MSLESALDELTAEIRRLQLVLPKIAASPLSVPTLQDTTAALAPAEESVKKRTKKEKPAVAGEVQGSISLPEPVPVGALSSEELGRRAATLTLELVAKKDRSAATTLLARFGAKKTIDIPTDKRAEYIDAAEQELSA